MDYHGLVGFTSEAVLGAAVLEPDGLVRVPVSVEFQLFCSLEAARQQFPEGTRLPVHVTITGPEFRSEKE